MLNQGEKLVSKNGKYTALMQSDGNLVIYTAGTPIWASNSGARGTPPFRLVMQADGNLVIYGANRFVWNSGVLRGTAPFKLIMQDDGNLCIYDSKNSFIWNSGSAR